MKTIREYLNELLEPYRTQALANTNEMKLNCYAIGLEQAVKTAFVWIESHEGHDYWQDLHDGIKADKFAEEHYEEQQWEAQQEENNHLPEFED